MSADPHDQYRELAAGYALHALEPEDEATLLAHLPGCAACRAEVDAGEAALAELAYTLPGTPPAGLRDTILAGKAEPEERPARVVQLHPRRSPARTAPWLLAAAASVVAVAVAVGNLGLRHDVRDTRTQLASARQVLACAGGPHCDVHWLASPDGTRRAAVLVDGTHARLVVDGLARNDKAHEEYVLWQRRPTGTMVAVRGFDISTSRITDLDAGTLSEPYTGFAVSREPGRTLPNVPTDPVLLPA
jgi:anti-sigma-K factor RskA